MYKKNFKMSSKYKAYPKKQQRSSKKKDARDFNYSDGYGKTVGFSVESNQFSSKIYIFIFKQTSFCTVNPVNNQKIRKSFQSFNIIPIPSKYIFKTFKHFSI